MCHKFMRSSKQTGNFGRSQQGSALTIALWILVIGGLISATLLQFRQQNSESLVYQMQGQRAYTLAQSQLELALVQLFPLDLPVQQCASVSPGRTWSADGWQGCVTTVSCQQVTVESHTSFRLVSTATCGSGRLMSSRSVALEAGI